MHTKCWQVPSFLAFVYCFFYSTGGFGVVSRSFIITKIMLGLLAWVYILYWTRCLVFPLLCGSLLFSPAFYFVYIHTSGNLKGSKMNLFIFFRKIFPSYVSSSSTLHLPLSHALPFFFLLNHFKITRWTFKYFSMLSLSIRTDSYITTTVLSHWTILTFCFKMLFVVVFILLFQYWGLHIVSLTVISSCSGLG